MEVFGLPHDVPYSTILLCQGILAPATKGMGGAIAKAKEISQLECVGLLLMGGVGTEGTVTGEMP